MAYRHIDVNKKSLSKALLTALISVLCVLCLIACGKNDEAPTELSVPQNLRIENEVLRWDAVEGAVGYDVKIDHKTYKTEAPELNIFLITSAPKTYAMKVRATGSKEWSEPIDYSIAHQLNGLGLNPINDNEYEIAATNRYAIKGKLIIPQTAADGRPITRIAQGAFNDCTGLTGILMSDTVKTVGAGAFGGCVNLATVRLPSQLTEISAVTFSGCENLKSIDLPDGVEYIRSGAFENCKSLTEITLPGGVKNIENAAFLGCTSLAEITLPESLEFFGQNVFSRCDSLSSISVDILNMFYIGVGNCLISLSNYAVVAGCKTSVIPDCARSIGAAAFVHCSGLTEITVPGNVKRIEFHAFYACESLKKVTLESGVQATRRAFSSCTALEEVTLPDTLTDIEAGTFAECYNIESITVDGNNPVYKSDSNCLIRKADNSLIAGCMTSDIPDYVESIYANAFDSFPITHITVKTNGQSNKNPGVLALPSGLKSIDSGAFIFCKALRTVRLPDEVTEISPLAFAYCSALETVLITDKSKITFSGRNTLQSAAVYTAYDELPDSWYRSDSSSRSTGISNNIVRKCEFAEDGNGLYVDSFVLDGDRSGFYRSSNLIAPYREGYSFVGWAQNSRDGELLNGLEKINRDSGIVDTFGYKAGEVICEYAALSVESIRKLPDETVLYAVWEPIAK